MTLFLFVDSRQYKRRCPSVCPSVDHVRVDQSGNARLRAYDTEVVSGVIGGGVFHPGSPVCQVFFIEYKISNERSHAQCLEYQCL